MGIQHWSLNIILVNLSRRWREHDELQRVVHMVEEKGDSNVVVDFSRVDVMGGAMFSWLLQLRRLLQARGGRLVLCGVAPATRDIFTIARLDEVFDLVENRFAAWTHWHMMG